MGQKKQKNNSMKYLEKRFTKGHYEKKKANALPAGGKHPKRFSPPTTAASPEFSRPTTRSPPANILSPELNYPARNPNFGQHTPYRS